MSAASREDALRQSIRRQIAAVLAAVPPSYSRMLVAECILERLAANGLEVTRRPTETPGSES